MVEVADLETRIWSDRGTKPAIGDETYQAGYQPIAAYDNWWNWAVSEDLRQLRNEIKGLDDVFVNTNLPNSTEVMEGPLSVPRLTVRGAEGLEIFGESRYWETSENPSVTDANTYRVIDSNDSGDVGHLFERYFPGGESQSGDTKDAYRSELLTVREPERASNFHYKQQPIYYGEEMTPVPKAIGSSQEPVESIHGTELSVSDYHIVSPVTHDFDDIVAELNDGKDVFAVSGDYPGDATQKTVTGGSLTMADGAQIVVPDNPPGNWLDIRGATDSPTDITANVSAGDTVLSVNDTSTFESGQPALISDSKKYLAGSKTMLNGECVLVSEIVDDTTLELRTPLELSHSRSNNISIEAVDPLTSENSWTNVTFDCRGTVQAAGEHPLIQQYYVQSHKLQDITFVNGNGSGMHQYLEQRHSLNPQLVNAESGMVDDGELGLLVSPEQRTRNAEIIDCTVHHGSVCQFGIGGQGPSVGAEFRNVTSYGARFSSSNTERRVEYRNCRVYYASSDYNGDQRAFLSRGYKPRFVNCHVYGGQVGWLLAGVGEEIVNCTTEDVHTVFKADPGDISERSDAGSEQVTVNNGTFDGVTYLTQFHSSHEGIRILDSNSIGKADASWIVGSSTPNAVTFGGGYMENMGYGIDGLPKLTVRHLEYNGRESDQQFIRDTSSVVNEELIFRGCDFYGTGAADAVRIENYDYIQMSGCRVPAAKAPVGQYLFREQAGNGGCHCVLRGNDGRNTQSGNGFSTSGTPITDGANLDSAGNTF